MKQTNCGCGDTNHTGCAGCRSEQIFAYWCESCRRSVADKRCPYCGLKAKKKREEGGQG